MVEKTFAAKDIIFREGDPSDTAYIIRNGKVEILKHAAHGEVQLAMLGEGQTFGEMGVLFEPQAPRSATARAATETLVDVVSEDELREMLGQCPPRLIPIVMAVFDRLRVTNQRVSNAEQATILLETDIQRIVIQPISELVKQNLRPVEVLVARLPFRIGGYLPSVGVNRTDQNHLNIPTEGPPQVVSRQHCQIAIEDNGIYVVDLASRFGTFLNGKQIGRGRGVYRAPLQKGKNELKMGGLTSAYIFEIECS